MLRPKTARDDNISFVEATPESGFMQSSWWADFRLAAGYEHFAVIPKNNGAIVGGAVVMKYSYADDACFYYIPEGPVLFKDEEFAGEVFDAILRQIDQRRQKESKIVSHLLIEPRWLQQPGYVTGFQVPPFKDPFREPRNTICVDLTAPEETILARMKPKGRYNIRVAQRHGITVVEDNSQQGIMDFIRLYKRTTTRHDIETKPSGYFREMMSILLLQERGSIYFAEYLGRRLAAAIVVYFGDRATYFFGGSLIQYRSVMAPYLLHFEIMRRAKAMGLAWYDLWGVSPENDQTNSWHAISVFKRKFGGKEFNFIPTLDFIYDSMTYDRFISEQSIAKEEKTTIQMSR
ncbi:MAG: peptidoglycan bridge formation glycyltransferase FemA/FemB family protein [Ignavibacteriales bacterium]|nr:peptidoglycan bridge formation glycyltransferase FemA/FemB family protein [Ignavibacteriales bacterium]